MSARKDNLSMRLSLGREVAERVKDFKELAQLGYGEAEMLAALNFMKYLNENVDKPLEEQLAEGIKLIGRAHFLPNTKEITRLCLILGDTRKRKKWKKT